MQEHSQSDGEHENKIESSMVGVPKASVDIPSEFLEVVHQHPIKAYVNKGQDGVKKSVNADQGEKGPHGEDLPVVFDQEQRSEGGGKPSHHLHGPFLVYRGREGWKWRGGVDPLI